MQNSGGDDLAPQASSFIFSTAHTGMSRQNPAFPDDSASQGTLQLRLGELGQHGGRDVDARDLVRQR